MSKSEIGLIQYIIQKYVHLDDHKVYKCIHSNVHK